MIRKQACLPFLLACLLIGGCQTAAVPAARATVDFDDTATEVALFGLVSWANRPDPDDPDQLQLFALMPSTTDEMNNLKEPECLGGEMPAPMQHYPVLKIVTGDATWNGGNALPTFQGQPRIFSIAGQDVTIVDNNFDPLSMRGFHMLSSDTTLGSTRSTTYTGSYEKVELDSDLLDAQGNGDPRLATRVLFTHGAVMAKISEYCSYEEPNKYLAEANTTGAGPPKTGCPLDESIDPTPLAEEVIARMSASGKTLTLRFHEWGTTPTERVLVVKPAATGEGVRVELSHQMKDPAAHGDSRDDEEVMCTKDNLRDYLWYYDLRTPQQGCADLDPAFFPCYDLNVGGTKCPEHNWGP